MDGVCIPDYLDPDSDGDGKPSDYGLLFHFLDAVVVGATHDPHEVGGAQRRSRRLFLTVLHFVFGFSLGGPEAAGGRPH